MSAEVERHQPTELERQAHWEQDANALAARYAGIVSLEDLSPEERVLSLLSLIPAYSAVVEEARDTIERLNNEVEQLDKMRYDLELVDDGFCDVYMEMRSVDQGRVRLLRAIDDLREWRKQYGMEYNLP